MRRILHSLLVATSILAVALPAAAGGQATDPPPSRPFDIASVTLTPSELDALGLPGFGLANHSSIRDAETDALVQADGDAAAAAERLAAYRDAGFQARYVGSLLAPRLPLVRRRSGLIDADVRISTAVADYGSAEGAAAGFAFDEVLRDDHPGSDVPGTRTFGERSEVTRSSGTETLSGEPFQRLELTFLVGPAVADVTIVDYRNIEPDLATIERLAEALQAKLERARAAERPGIGMRTLRLLPADAWIDAGRLRDFYVRKDGQHEPTFAEIVSAIDAGEAAATPAAEPAPRPGTVLPIDTYLYWTPVGDGDPLDLPLYVAWLDHYASPEQAAAALGSITDDLGPGYFDVEEFRAAETIGEQSREWVYEYEDAASGAVRGVLVVVRVGSDLIRLQVDGPNGVRGDGVRALAQVQADCLTLEEDFCPPITALDALARLAPPVSP